MTEAVALRSRRTGRIYAWVNVDDGRLYRERGLYTRMTWKPMQEIWRETEPDRTFTIDEMLKMVDANVYERFGFHMPEADAQRLAEAMMR